MYLLERNIVKKLLATLLLFVSILGGAVAHAQGSLLRPGDVRTAAQVLRDCAAGIATDSCSNGPAPHACPVGQHWSLAGTGLAHCVAVDPVCSTSPMTILTHDALGNPSCVAPPTCNNGATNYPACDAFPSCANGATNYPACTTFPSCGNGATNYPACNTFPSCGNGATDYPSCVTFPTCGNGATDYPACVTFPTCGNGATNYPACNVFPSCGNGATNYPACNVFPSCANGATDYPTCTSVPVSCPEPHTYCSVLTFGSSGDPRDNWYSIGWTYYEGPTCTPVNYETGMNTEWDGGCTRNGINY